MSLSSVIQPELGIVSRYLDVPDLIIRPVLCHGINLDFEDGIPDEDHDEAPDSGPRYEDRLQGRLVNTAKHRLSDIKYDLAYYDPDGTFLGLNKSRFLEEDELDVADYLPIDMKVDLPEGTAKCVFSVRAKKPGIVGRIFWG